eukprot:GGOE01006030.1.p3 GENE.GGOE01006030.1~~GGOE01006030.1.p3  ORF type:complete len:123 (+),score=4.16 GGOE01006030.1:96-464(+)
MPRMAVAVGAEQRGRGTVQTSLWALSAIATGFTTRRQTEEDGKQYAKCSLPTGMRCIGPEGGAETNDHGTVRIPGSRRQKRTHGERKRRGKRRGKCRGRGGVGTYIVCINAWLQRGEGALLQ